MMAASWFSQGHRSSSESGTPACKEEKGGQKTGGWRDETNIAAFANGHVGTGWQTSEGRVCRCQPHATQLPPNLKWSFFCAAKESPPCRQLARLHLGHVADGVEAVAFIERAAQPLSQQRSNGAAGRQAAGGWVEARQPPTNCNCSRRSEASFQCSRAPLAAA